MNNSTILELAIMQNSLDIVKFLVINGANINYITCDGLTPLHLSLFDFHFIRNAMKEGNFDFGFPIENSQYRLEIANYLIMNRADIDCKTGDGVTPLHVATKAGHLEIVKQLIMKRAYIECKTNDGFTPLHIASKENHLEILEYLVLHGADTNCKENNGYTPLHIASFLGYLEIVIYLVLKGADTNCKENDEYAPLHFASNEGTWSRY